MAAVGVGLGFTSIASILSTVFALSIALQSYLVYRRTRRGYFLEFGTGFIMLAASYALLIPLAFGVMLPTVGYPNSDILDYPPRIITSSIGFVIIALSYSSAPRIRQILYLLVALLGFLVLLVIGPQISAVPYSIDNFLYVLHIGLLVYVLYQMWRVTRPIVTVFWGFVVLLVSQCIGLVDAFQPQEITFLLTQAVRVVSFGLLFAALARANRPKLIERPDKAKGI
jgi:hypothetical protein